MSKLREGDTVRCLAGNIDNGRGNGMIGRINGFARLSPYHAREALVSFDDHPEDNAGFGSTTWQELRHDHVYRNS